MAKEDLPPFRWPKFGFHSGPLLLSPPYYKRHYVETIAHRKLPAKTKDPYPTSLRGWIVWRRMECVALWQVVISVEN